MSLSTGFFFILVLAACWLLYRVQRDEQSPFDYADLFMTDGKSDLRKVFFALGFGVLSWVVFTLTINDGLSDAVFGLYVGAVCAAGGMTTASDIFKSKGDQ